MVAKPRAIAEMMHVAAMAVVVGVGMPGMLQAMGLRLLLVRPEAVLAPLVLALLMLLLMLLLSLRIVLAPLMPAVPLFLMLLMLAVLAALRSNRIRLLMEPAALAQRGKVTTDRQSNPNCCSSRRGKRLWRPSRCLILQARQRQEKHGATRKVQVML